MVFQEAFDFIVDRYPGQMKAFLASCGISDHTVCPAEQLVGPASMLILYYQGGSAGAELDLPYDVSSAVIGALEDLASGNPVSAVTDRMFEQQLASSLDLI